MISQFTEEVLEVKDWRDLEWLEYEEWCDEKDDKRLVTRICGECGKLKPCKFIDDPYETEMAHEGDEIVKRWLCHPCYEDVYGEI